MVLLLEEGPYWLQVDSWVAPLVEEEPWETASAFQGEVLLAAAAAVLSQVSAMMATHSGSADRCQYSNHPSVVSSVDAAVGKTGTGYAVAVLLVMAFPTVGTDLVPFVVAGVS